MKLDLLVTTLTAISVASAWLKPLVPHKAHVERAATSVSNNPLGFATKTVSATSYGFLHPPTGIPSNLPNFPSFINFTGSTSWDANNNPFFPNGPYHRGNWLPGYDINTPPNKWPTTGRTVYYNFNVQNMTLSPDGTPKQMLVINGQYPGPLVEANWGDWIQVTVNNQLQHNGTGIHWHGFRQINTNTEDGVGGITECPIAPGQSTTYRFQATSYGTSWYHSHFSAQYGDGVLGPVLIHGPAAANYDIDLGTFMVNDFYPLTVFQEDWFAHRFGPPTASNYLINGKNMKPDGSAGTRPTWQFVPGRKHLMRFINNAVDNHFKLQLDGHTFTVIANDFVPINPYQTKELSIGIGQRYDVIVVADQKPAAYYLRALAAPGCSQNLNPGTGTANGIIYYAGVPPSVLPVVNSTITIANPACNDEPLASLVPVVQQSVDSTGFASGLGNLPVNLGRATLTDGENVFLWYLNSISQDIDWSQPTIQTVSLNHTVATAANASVYFPQQDDVIALETPGVWTFWVIQNQFFVPHPIHLHGHDFAVLGEGNGTFNAALNMGSLNFKNPTRRDVAMLIASGWTVIAFKAENPGSWLMHCHIAWHVGEGLSLQFLELPQQIPGLYAGKVGGGGFQNQCRSWNSYFASAANVYGKSDSGL